MSPISKEDYKDFKWQKAVASFQKPSTLKSLWQVANTVIPYIAVWYFMYLSLSVSYLLTLALAVLAALFTLRLFIIFHDCTHGSFLKNKKVNDMIGRFCGMLVFTPYRLWQHEHAVHHATAGNLEKRGVGDIWTMTVKEYKEATKFQRLKYRMFRHPLVLFVIGPPYLFMFKQRLVLKTMNKNCKKSVYLTDLSILILIVGISSLIGFKNYLLIQVPIISIASCLGVWLFYVQHQFEGVYWDHAKNWNYVKEALEGSSFYKLPKVLQWFTGSIGFHHVHHLSPLIPNYLLEKCHESNERFQKAPTITLLESIKSFSFRLWDDDNMELVSFDILKSKKS